MVDPAALDLAHLAQFTGDAFNAKVLAALGSQRLRTSHGYLVQHLLSGPKTVGQLAELLGVTQQAVSKAVKEMGDLLSDAASDDARVRRVQLSKRGLAIVEKTRTTRRVLDAKLRAKLGARRVDQARAVLLEALELLGGLDAVRHRRVRPPA